MEEFKERHRRMVTNYCGGKIEELQYQLMTIVTACNASLVFFNNRQQVTASSRQAVIYGFSSFTNVIQTLKDTIKIMTGEQLPWSEIKQLRHGSFFHDARNAATHDGNPIIDAWVEGRYYIASSIIRLGVNGQVIEIPAPSEDVRTLCLEFTEDLCQLLRQKILDTKESNSLKGSPFNMDELEKALTKVNLVPDFAIKLFIENRDKIAKSISESKHDPVAEAIKHLDALQQYCNEQL